MHMWATEVKTKPKKTGPKHASRGFETSIKKTGLFIALPEVGYYEH
jgi:hypothetical protein